MAVLKVKRLGLVLIVCAFYCFLCQQGSFAVSSISPSSSVVPALAPNAEETTRQISDAKTFRSDAPASTSQPTGTMSHLPVAPAPLNYVPGPQIIAPDLLPNASPSLPPSSSDHPPSGIVPVSSPRNDQLERPRQSPEHSVAGRPRPVPVASSPRQSPQKSPIFNPPMNVLVPPNPNQNDSSKNVPSVQFAPAPSTLPDLLPPAPTLPKTPPHDASVFSLSPYSSVVPSLAPMAKESTGHISKGKSLTSPVPSSAPHENGGVSLSPASNNQSGIRQNPGNPAPGTPGPSPQKSPAYEPLMPFLGSPTPNQYSPVNVPLAPGLNSGKNGKPVAAPMVGPGYRHTPAYAPHSRTDENHSTINAPSAQKGKEDSNTPPLPYSSPAPNFSSEEPAAVPSTTTQRHHHQVDRTAAPASTVKGVPPPLPYPEYAPNFGSEPFASVPSTTTQRHHYPIVRTPAPALAVDGVPPIFAPHSSSQPSSPFPSTSTKRHRHPKHKPSSPPSSISGVPQASPKEEPDHPKTDFRHRGPPPLSSDNHNSPAASPPRTNTVPLPIPKAPHARSLPKFPKMPVQLLPPPPPDEDCAKLTCYAPLTNGPPGPPCLCVLPILVGLRLSVELYTFFPLVSELATEISAGVLLKQSQVRIMGANEATQDSGKTIVLIELVPLGEKFDRASAYLIFQRFWHKQVNIRASLFSDYEVLYVRYPGLPPSPPAASPDIDAIYNDPYHNHGNNPRTMKPLGVDVSRIRHNKGPNRSVIAVIVLSASLALILSCVLVWVFILKNRVSVSGPEIIPRGDVTTLGKSSGGLASVVGSGQSSVSVSLGPDIATYTGSAKTFSSSDMERATSNFDEMRVLGEGGFGRVYSGVLDDGTEVAVKVLKRDDLQGGREFLAEVEMLSRLHHRNLVKLIGICAEERARSLVYELVPNGSVESHLHGIDKGIAPLDWSARLKIALGAARGLAYLHEDSSPRVIHRDFKASNILLEHDFTARVSDFGLARTALDDNRHISTRVMGTFGYVAPEYAMTGHLLVKSDVYSYGVVLLELLTGRKPVDMSQPAGQENLVSFARPLLTSKEGLELIVDHSLGPNVPFDSISKVAAIASMCVEPEVSNRPFMGEVVQALRLVCNECEQAKELGSTRYSQENISIDMDARISSHSEVSRHDHQIDVENVHSVSDLLSSSIRSERIENEYLRRHSSSGPLRSMDTRRLLQHMRRLSGGSISKHGIIRRSKPGSL